MTDIFSEIEQDLRREKVSVLWEKYGIYLVGLGIGIVVAAAAVVGWQAWQKSQTEASSVKYDAVMAEVATQKPEEAAATLDAFAKDATKGYAMLAQMQQSGELLKAGDSKGAVSVLDKIANNRSVSPLLRGMARIKAGLILVDTATYDEMNARMAPLDESGNMWRSYARELLGLSAYKAGKYAEAETNFSAIIADNISTPGLRDRAHVMQALIAPHLPTPVVADNATDKSNDTKTAEPVPTNGAQAAPDTKSE